MNKQQAITERINEKMLELIFTWQNLENLDLFIHPRHLW